MPSDREVLTIGHSNHSVDWFQQLLFSHEVEALVDVRSWPHSRYVAWADRSELPHVTDRVGSKYLFLGDQLGGRPEADDCYDRDGHVLYGKVAASSPFQTGIERLERGIEKFKVAIMCSEEDPTHCHRRLLVSKVLIERGMTVIHIRGAGRAEAEPGPIRFVAGTLLDDEEGLWRSSRSVLRKRRQKTS